MALRAFSWRAASAISCAFADREAQKVQAQRIAQTPAMRMRDRARVDGL